MVAFVRFTLRLHFFVDVRSVVSSRTCINSQAVANFQSVPQCREPLPPAPQRPAAPPPAPLNQPGQEYIGVPDGSLEDLLAAAHQRIRLLEMQLVRGIEQEQDTASSSENGETTTTTEEEEETGSTTVQEEDEETGSTTVQEENEETGSTTAEQEEETGSTTEEDGAASSPSNDSSGDTTSLPGDEDTSVAPAPNPPFRKRMCAQCGGQQAASACVNDSCGRCCVVSGTYSCPRHPG